jgi:hypothetical protein
MATPFEQQCEALLMHLEETERADNAADEFLAALGVKKDRRYAVVQFLVDRGLATDVSTLEGVDCWLTGAGHQMAQQLISQRPARRVAELRARMLRWLELESDPTDWSGFLDSDQVDYRGEPFTGGDVEHQAEFLYNSGLITAVHVDEAMDGTLRPELTSRGRDCSVHGGDVVAYLGIGGQPSRTTYNTTSQNTHIGSISGGQQAFHSSDFTQVQHNQPAAGYEELAQVVQQLLAQLPHRPELTDQAREEIHEAAEETLEVITSPEPKPSKVRRMVDGIVGVLGRVATTLGQGALQGTNESTTQWATEHTQLLSAPVAAASATNCCIVTSASAAWSAQHHSAPLDVSAGAASATPANSRRTCAQRNWCSTSR